MATKNTPATQSGIVVSTQVVAGPGSGSGGVWLNHTEGIVVSTGLTAGPTPKSIRTIVLRG